MSKIQLVTQANLPTEYGIFKMVGFEFPDTKKEHVALVMGDISNQDELHCVKLVKQVVAY